jgi:hypothetical protein
VSAAPPASATPSKPSRSEPPHFLTFGPARRRIFRGFREPAPKNSQLAVIHRGAPKSLTKGSPNPHAQSPESSRTSPQALTKYSPITHDSAKSLSYYKTFSFPNLNSFEIKESERPQTLSTYETVQRTPPNLRTTIRTRPYRTDHLLRAARLVVAYPHERRCQDDHPPRAQEADDLEVFEAKRRALIGYPGPFDGFHETEVPPRDERCRRPSFRWLLPVGDAKLAPYRLAIGSSTSLRLLFSPNSRS